MRNWDMGLRIRGIDSHYEMTIKTAGKSGCGGYINAQNIM